VLRKCQPGEGVTPLSPCFLLYILDGISGWECLLSGCTFDSGATESWRKQSLDSICVERNKMLAVPKWPWEVGIQFTDSGLSVTDRQKPKEEMNCQANASMVPIAQVPLSTPRKGEQLGRGLLSPGTKTLTAASG
jgi:hypothetical protein